MVNSVSSSKDNIFHRTDQKDTQALVPKPARAHTYTVREKETHSYAHLFEFPWWFNPLLFLSSSFYMSQESIWVGRTTTTNSHALEVPWFSPCTTSHTRRKCLKFVLHKLQDQRSKRDEEFQKLHSEVSELRDQLKRAKEDVARKSRSLVAMKHVKGESDERDGELRSSRDKCDALETKLQRLKKQVRDRRCIWRYNTFSKSHFYPYIFRWH